MTWWVWGAGHGDAVTIPHLLDQGQVVRQRPEQRPRVGLRRRRVCKATAAEISLSLDQDREQSERGTTDYDKRTFAWREWRIGSPNRLCSNWPWAGIEGLSGEPDAKKEPGSSSQVLWVPS